MKRIMGIIILSFVFFTAGSIFGTGGIDTKPTIASLQTETFEMGYTAIIDIWTAFNQIEVFVISSQENIETSFNHFRKEQMKIAVAGLVNYKSGNSRQLDIQSLDKQPLQINEPVTPVANQKTDFPTNHEPLNYSTQINVVTTDNSMNPLMKNPQVKHPKVKDIEVE